MFSQTLINTDIIKLLYLQQFPQKKQNKQAKNKNITTQKTEATRTTPTRPCIDWMEQSKHNMTHRQLCHCPSNQLAHFLLHHHIQKGN
jgi:hypothetical protein